MHARTHALSMFIISDRLFPQLMAVFCHTRDSCAGNRYPGAQFTSFVCKENWATNCLPVAFICAVCETTRRAWSNRLNDGNEMRVGIQPNFSGLEQPFHLTLIL